MKKRIVFFVLLCFVLLCFVFAGKNGELKDNYYLTINKDIIEQHELEENEYSWSYFLEAQDRADDNVEVIVSNILNDNSDVLEDKEMDVIQKIYYKALDVDKRNSDRLGDLDGYLDRVWNISNVEELVDAIILIENDLSIGLLTNIEIMQDYKDNNKSIIYFVPVTYAFGANSDYIINDDYMAYKAYMRRACVQLWRVYGYNNLDARSVVDKIFNFYESISKYSKLSNELSDITSYYNLVSGDDVDKLFSNVAGSYLSRRGISFNDVYSLVDVEQYKYLNDSLNVDNLEVWKYIIVTKILSSYANYGSSDYVEVVSNLNESLSGVDKDISNEEQAVNLVRDIFSGEIDRIYDNDYLNDVLVDDINKMFVDIKDTFKVRIRNNRWLSEKAKDRALIKLDKMDIIIGVEDMLGYNIASNFMVSDDSLINDIIRIRKIAFENSLDRLNSGEKVFLVSQTSVNAYYQPLDNSIVIPVAFFELVDIEDNYYEKLGTIGMILAHEVTHAFDGNGSKFDEFGNLNNWWSDKDIDKFEELSDYVSKYYGKYEVIDGKYINGEKTVNENIADLGAVACIVDIVKEKKATDEDMKLMFSSFAKLWVSVESEEYMDLLLLQDVHAPNQFRVNGVLSSIDEFYDVYDIYPWHDMWINDKDRVMVW